MSRHKGRSRSPVPVCLPGSAEGRSVVKPEVDPSRCTDRKTSISSAETGLSDDRKEREQARGRQIAHIRPEALREWRVRALRDSTPAAAKRRAVDRRDRASGANTIKSIDRIHFCRSNPVVVLECWGTACRAPTARLGARQVWFSDGGALQRVPGTPGCAGVSPACSDATVSWG